MRKALCSLICAGMFICGCQPIASLAAAEPAATARAADAKPAGAKDLFYRQMQAPQAVSNYGLRYSIELQRGGKTYIVGSRFPFQTGDQIRFHVRPNIDGYMYIVLKSGSTGNSAVLFPSAEVAESNLVRHGTEYVLPAEGTLEFDANPGMETLELMLSQQPLNQTIVDSAARRITIEPKGTPKFGTHCFIDSPDALESGAPGKSDEQVTLVTTDLSAPLSADLLLQHLPAAIEKDKYVVTADFHNRSQSPETLLPATSSQTPTQSSDSPVLDKWALVVGVSKFKRPGFNLLFASKDAKDFGSFLVSEEHFAPDHVRVLTDDQATRENILTNLGNGWLPYNVKPGDLVVIYFATHATSAGDDVANKNFLVAYDTNPLNAYVTGIELQDLARTIKRRLNTNRVMIILDTCHAAAANDKSVFITPKTDLEKAFQGTGQLILASSGPDQVSYDSVKYGNGLFTKFLIEGLRKYPDLKGAFEYIRTKVEVESVKEYGHPQVPELKDKEWQGTLAVLSARPAQPRPSHEGGTGGL